MIWDVAACRSQLLKNIYAITTRFSQHNTDLEISTLSNILQRKIPGKTRNMFLSSLLMDLAQASLLSAIVLADIDYFPLWFLADNFHFQIFLWWTFMSTTKDSFRPTSLVLPSCSLWMYTYPATKFYPLTGMKFCWSQGAKFVQLSTTLLSYFYFCTLVYIRDMMIYTFHTVLNTLSTSVN